MTQTPAADIVEPTDAMCWAMLDTVNPIGCCEMTIEEAKIGLRAAFAVCTEIEALRAREADLQHQLMLAKAFGGSEADAHNAAEARAKALQRKLDEAVKAAQAVVDSADRPGARMGLNMGPNGEDVWINHREVDEVTLDALSATLASIRGETD